MEAGSEERRRGERHEEWRPCWAGQTRGGNREVGDRGATFDGFIVFII
jgi:hypothetical protein